MNEPKHTPGPWTTDGGPYVQALYTPTDGGKPFYHAVARTDQPLVLPEQAIGNSRLIAAAPELLDALVNLRKGISPDMDTKDCEYLRNVIDAAIDKAKGGAP